MDVVLNPARKNLEEAILSWIDLQEGSGELPRVFVFTNPEGNRTFCPTLPKREFTITYATSIITNKTIFTERLYGMLRRGEIDVLGVQRDANNKNLLYFWAGNYD